MTPPAAKPPAKPAAPPDHPNLGLKIETVPIDSVTPHPDNARRGDLDAVAASLTAHGQFRPLVVQKSSGHVLAGNHTWRAAKEKLDWLAVDITRIDVDDAQAKRILLVDNRTSDLAGYDDKALLTLLQEFDGELAGTGWDIDDLTELQRITGALGQDRGSFLDDLRGDATTTDPGGGRNHFQLMFPCTEAQRDHANRVLRQIQSDRELSSSVEAIMWLLDSYQPSK